MQHLLVAMIFMVSVNTALSEELVVDPSSCSGNNAYCDIQSAIDAASDSDVVMLTKGSYELWQESITINKSITLQGESPDNTLLLGEGAAPSTLIVVTSDAEAVVLKQLTVADRIVSGSSTMGPGGLDHRGGDLTIDNVTFKKNQGGWGGAVRITTLFGSVHIRDSKFIDNTGFAGGGLAVYDGSALELLIEGSHFSGNRAVFSGGALLMRDVAEARLERVEIRDNTVGNTGGGVHAFTISGTVNLAVVDSIIEDNDASKVGGVSTHGEGITVTLQDSQLRNNKSRNQLPTTDCGGVSFKLLNDNAIGQPNRCQN